jgi:hypothetical protein
VALWRTSAAVAALLLVATACGQTSDSDEAASRTTVASRPQLAPVGQTPLTVKGTGFQPNEKVQVGAKGAVKGSSTATTAADSSGTFVVRLPGLNNCDSITVVANGSTGTHAEFNLSQIVCNGS